MNKALIEKALNEGTLRHAILRDLGVGTHVVAGNGYQGEVLAHHADQVVFGWENGQVNGFAYDEQHCVYLAPLCFVEDKPVYKGDTLYRQSGAHVTMRGLNTNGTTLLFEEGGSWNLDDGGRISKLYWTKPVPTININGYEVPMPEREAPGGDTKYFFPLFQQEGGVYSYTWSGDAYDNRLLSAGMVHLTEEAAKKHTEALASFTRKEFRKCSKS